MGPVNWDGIAGGDLLEVYDEESDEGVVRFADEKLVACMYNDGRATHVITFPDFLRWKKAQGINLAGADEPPPGDALHLDPPHAQFATHQAPLFRLPFLP